MATSRVWVAALLAAVVCSAGVVAAFGGGGDRRVRLQDVTTITLLRGEYTAGRRSAPVPQLNCVGGTAAGDYSPTAVQCTQVGFDGVDAQWKCEADMPSEIEFGRIQVSCEGYDYPDDPFVLAGSCGLEYELNYARNAGRQRAHHGNDHRYQQDSYRHESHRSGDPGYRRGEDGLHRHMQNRNSGGMGVGTMIMFAVVAFIFYNVCCGRRRGSGSSPPPPSSSGSRPPPQAPRGDNANNNANNNNNNNNNNDDYGGGFKQRTTTTAAPTATATGNSGPGFWTGLGAGALGGYLFGNRRRTPTYGAGYGSGYGSNYGSSFTRAAPSTSYRPSAPSGGTRRTTGFGGTTRR